MNRDHRETIDRACRRIDSADSAPSLATLAAEASLSPSHFQRLFKAAIGLSPKEYALARRRERLAHSLASAPSVTDAIYGAGYQASSAAYRDSQTLGMAPSRLRTGGSGERIRYAATSTLLGPLLVAATDRGICMVEFGSERPLLTELRKRFSQALIEPADAELQQWITRVVTFIDGNHSDPGLPLDLRGTAFQMRVWRALTGIPAGKTLSYSELARRIGAPTSTRAVARACASNHVAVLVPCHRVVASSGALTGYKWGITRKRRLLDQEQAASSDQPGVIER
jgi:AraC family transcriptional regulator, regulatory protein of adaptative response / methylated-DNA-[protein]-cysteine methyltransferase